MRILVLDSEAVSALADATSSKHQRVASYVEAVRGTRHRRAAAGSRLLVPTTVRVESGWDRTEPAAAIVNRLGIDDHALDAPAANRAARLRTTHDVSPADTHLGALLAELDVADVTVLTSDPGDLAAVAEGRHTRIVTL